MSNLQRTNSWLHILLLAQLLCIGSLLRSSTAHADEPVPLYFLGITQEGKPLPGLDEKVRQRLGALPVTLSPSSPTPDAACDGAPAVTAAAQQHTEQLVLAGQIRTSTHGCLILLWLHKKDYQQVTTRELTCSKTWSQHELASNVAELAGNLIEQIRQDALPEPAPSAAVQTVPPPSVPTPVQSRPGWSPVRKTFVVFSGLVFAGFLAGTLRAAALHGRPRCPTPEACDRELAEKLIKKDPMEPALLERIDTTEHQAALGVATGVVGTGLFVSIFVP